MERDEQRRDAALAEEPLRRGAPQAQVGRQRHRGEGHRQAGGRVEVRREVPQRHADVVLVGGQARRLAVGDLARRRAAPGPGELPGQPRVRGLADRHDALVVRAQEHTASVTGRGRRRRLRRHGPPPPLPARRARPGGPRRSGRDGRRGGGRPGDEAVPARLRLGRGDRRLPGRGGRHAVGRGPAARTGGPGPGARRASAATTSPTVPATGTRPCSARDVALARGLHARVFRLGVEWSRIFPRSTRAVRVSAHPTGAQLRRLDHLADHRALRRYRGMLRAVRGAGLQPFLTLSHFTLPLWVHDGLATQRALAGRGPDDPLPRFRRPAGWLDAGTVSGVPQVRRLPGLAARRPRPLLDAAERAARPGHRRLRQRPGRHRAELPARGVQLHRRDHRRRASRARQRRRLRRAAPPRPRRARGARAQHDRLHAGRPGVGGGPRGDGRTPTGCSTACGSTRRSGAASTATPTA